MISNIQSKEQEKEIILALREGKDALKKLHEENTLEDVLKLMDEVEEQNEIERQVNDILNQTGEELNAFEEEELERELQAMMGGAVTEESALNLPNVPTQELPTAGETQQVPTKKVQEGRVAVAS